MIIGNCGIGRERERERERVDWRRAGHWQGDC